MDKVKGWKTFSFAIAMALTSFLATPEFQAFVMENFAISGSVIALAIGGLRLITSSPIFKKA